MGKFKEIDQFCEKGDKEGLIAFLAEHGIQNPHKQANIYLEEYRMNKTVKISDINKEIAAEIQAKSEKTTLNKILDAMSDRMSALSERIDITGARIDIINERIDKLLEE